MSGFRYILLFITVCHFVLSLAESATPPGSGESKLCEGDTKVIGTVGKSLVLFRLHMIHPEYKTLLLKYTQNQSKLPLLDYDVKSKKHEELTNISLSKYNFSEEDKAVMIHNLQKDDEKDYEFVVKKKNRVEDFCTVKLKVYEQISNLTVSVTEDSQNNTCKVTMKCLMQTGDDVTFSWKKDNETLSHNSNTLDINFTSDDANSTFWCTAQNSVSEQSSNYTLSFPCSPNKDNSHHSLILYILVPTFILLAVIVIVIIVTVIKKVRNKGMYLKRCISPPNSSQGRPPPPPPVPVSEQTNEAVQTVYAIVRKPENHRTYSFESKSLPFSSVYELAGPCPAYPQ